MEESWTKSNLIDNLPRTAVKGLTPSSKIDTPVMLEIVPNKNASFGLKKHNSKYIEKLQYW